MSNLLSFDLEYLGLAHLPHLSASSVTPYGFEGTPSCIYLKYNCLIANSACQEDWPAIQCC